MSTTGIQRNHLGVHGNVRKICKEPTRPVWGYPPAEHSWHAGRGASSNSRQRSTPPWGSSARARDSRWRAGSHGSLSQRESPPGCRPGATSSCGASIAALFARSSRRAILATILLILVPSCSLVLRRRRRLTLGQSLALLLLRCHATAAVARAHMRVQNHRFKK